MKHAADKKRTDRQYSVGERVYLKLQPYAQSSVVKRPCPKLAFKFFGPYTILAKVGEAAYKLDLPEGSLVHPVFHVSQLKPHVPDYTPVFTSLPQPVDFLAQDLVPKQILDRRLVKKGNAAHLQVLLKWSTLPAEMATREDNAVVRERYPDAPAWGQAEIQGGMS